MKNIISILAAAALVAVGWYGRGWVASPPPEVLTVTDTVKGDSIPYVVEVPVPVARYVTLPPDTVLLSVDIDTMEIVADYLAMYHYSDTLMNDTSAFIALSEMVSQNKIMERSLTFQNRRATLITNTTIMQQPEPALQVYASLLAGNGFTTPVVQVGWKKWQVSAGYDLYGGRVVGGVGYRIR
jgi:hypothetical protein